MASFVPDFLITDPLAQPGVVTEVPEGVQMVDLDDVPYRAEPQVHCAFCKQRQLHNDGYFAILSDGLRAPCGNCCAANFDAAKKRTIDKSRVRLKRERESRQRAQSVSKGVDKLAVVAEDVDKALGDTAVATIVLEEILSEEACFDLEARGIQGLAILNGCYARVGFACASFQTIQRLTLGGITKEQQDKFSERRQLAVAELIKAVEYLNACREFFEPANIAAIEAWAKERGTQYGVRQFKMKNGRLHLKGPGLWQNIDVPSVSPPTVEEVRILATTP